MAVTFGFYDSKLGDRTQPATAFSDIFEGVIPDGIFASIGTSFVVTADGNNMTVNVGTGRSYFNKKWTHNDSPLPLTISAAETSLNRIDTPVLEINTNDTFRLNSFKVVKGTPAANPVEATLINDGTTFQYPLAYVRVNAGVTKITQADITNLVGTDKCPFVTGILQTTSVETINERLEQIFDAWLTDIKEALDGDVEAKLLAKINTKPGFDVLANQINTNQFNSYISWLTNANVDMMNVAFGKGNEDTVKGLGLQMAMYAWYKGESKTIYPFTALQTTQTLDEASNSREASIEINKSIQLKNLIVTNPFALDIFSKSFPLAGPIPYGNALREYKFQPIIPGAFRFNFVSLSSTSGGSTAGYISLSLVRVSDGVTVAGTGSLRVPNFTNSSGAHGMVYGSFDFDIPQTDIDSGGYNVVIGASNLYSWSGSMYVSSAKEKIVNENIKQPGNVIIQGPYEAFYKFTATPQTVDLITFSSDYTGNMSIVCNASGAGYASTITVSLYINNILTKTLTNQSFFIFDNLELRKDDIIKLSLWREGTIAGSSSSSINTAGIYNVFLTANAPENLVFSINKED